MKPRLHLICGMVGAGKTTLAHELEVSLPAIRLSPDEWILPLLPDPDDRAEMTRLRTPVEELQWELAERLLAQSANVILENGFWGREERLRYLETAHQIGAEVVLHYLDIPRTVLIERIERRNADLPTGSFRVSPAEVDTWLEWFIAPNAEELKLYDDHRIYTS